MDSWSLPNGNRNVGASNASLSRDSSMTQQDLHSTWQAKKERPNLAALFGFRTGDYLAKQRRDTQFYATDLDLS